MRNDWIADLYRLKETPRTGWLRIGIEHPESVADHSYATALLAWSFARKQGMDERRVLLMALLHDFHEARLGDIPSPEKRERGLVTVRAEERAVEAQQWKNDPEMLGLLEELRQGESEEARLANAADGLELLLQARSYLSNGHLGAEDFIRSILDSPAAAHPMIREFLDTPPEHKKNPPPKGEDNS